MPAAENATLVKELLVSIISALVLKLKPIGILTSLGYNLKSCPASELTLVNVPVIRIALVLLVIVTFSNNLPEEGYLANDHP